MKKPGPSQIDPARLRKRLPRRYRYVRLRWRLLFRLIDFFGGVLFGTLRLLSPRRTREPAVPRKILLIQLDHLGDAILSTPLVEGLSRCYPQASIEVLASSASAGWFAMLPQVSRVHVLEANRFARKSRRGWIGAVLAWGLRLRSMRFDLGVDVRGDFPIAVLMWLGGIRRRVGWTSGGGGFLLTDAPEWISNRHEVDSRLALLECITPTNNRDVAPFASLRKRFSSTESLSGCRQAAHPTVLVHLSAGTQAKQWPAEHWRDLIRLLDSGGTKVVLVGGDDARIIRDWIAAGSHWNRVEDRVGTTGLEELAAAAAQADVVVGADSAVVHLASAVGTPVVVLFSGDEPARAMESVGGTRHPVASRDAVQSLSPSAVSLARDTRA